MNRTLETSCAVSKLAFSWFFDPNAGFCLPFGDRWASFAPYGVQSSAKDRPYPHQVVSSQVKDGLRLDLDQSYKPGLAQATNGLRPPEDFINMFAQLQTDTIVRMPCRPAVNRTAFIRRHMWCHTAFTHSIDKFGDIVPLALR
jgi:hypothetical protein